MVKRVAKQFIIFCIVGFIGFILRVGFLFIFTEFFNIYYMLSSTLSFVIANMTTFVLNKTLTFDEKINHKPLRKYLIFFIISIIALIVNLSLLYIFTESLGVYYIYSQVFAEVFSLWINFLGNKYITFRKK